MTMKDIYIFQVELNPGELALLRNSKKVGRKGDKLVKRWLGPYQVEEVLGKGVHRRPIDGAFVPPLRTPN